MRRRALAIAGMLCLATFAHGRAAEEPPREVRLIRPIGLAQLPLLVVEHERLIEKHAARIGVGEVRVAWSQPGKDGALAALAAGEGDIAAVDLVPFAAAWDKESGTPQSVRAIAALARVPYVLVSRNPGIQTIRDFTPKDHIAVPGKPMTGPALMLEMAAAQEWGFAHYDKLDPFTIVRPDKAAAAALVAGKGDIDAHVAAIPYPDLELANPAIHRVMDSFDIAGPHSTAIVAASGRFHDANPTVCAALLAALAEADDFIKKNPGAAAELYAAMAQGEDISVEDLTDMIGDPDLAYETAPAGAMRLVDFLARTGRLRHHPQSWQELFFPEARALAGG